MTALLTAFGLGNSAILTNVCLLPLYPGLIAYLAGTTHDERSRLPAGYLGGLVLAGVLTLMLVAGLGLYWLKASIASILPVFLPISYFGVIGLGLLLLFGVNPFARLAMLQTPLLSNRYARAYLYGLLLGPMTLPCTGPIVVSMIVLSAGNIVTLSEGFLYFIAFGLGFGWPLIVLPLIARPAQKRFLSWLTHHHGLLTRLSALLLIVIGIFGFLSDYLPNLR